MDKSIQFDSPGTVAIATQGCKVNRYDSQVILEGLLSLGWELLPFGEPADLVIINSCTVTMGSDRDLRKLVRRARRGSPDARILVTGCKAEVDPEEVLALSEVDALLGNSGKERLPEWITRGLPSSEIAAGLSHPDRVEDPAITRLQGRARPILKVQDGCNLRCSFCIVPNARGSSRSRGARQTVERALLLHEHGFHEIVLSGIQLGLYRDPDGEAINLESLLRRLLDETPVGRFRLGSILPRHVTPGLIALFEAEPKRLCPHFHVSLQSGDDGVLQMMKRPYRSAYFVDRMLELWNRLAAPCLGTDIIVGHPGEDEAAFENTFQLVEQLPLAYGHVFPFSLRPGTRAGQWGDTIDMPTKKRRSASLRSLFDAKGIAYRESQIDRTLTVVVEKSLGVGVFKGTSENYQPVRLDAQSLRPGEAVRRRIVGLQDCDLVADSDIAQEAVS